MSERRADGVELLRASKSGSGGGAPDQGSWKSVEWRADMAASALVTGHFELTKVVGEAGKVADCVRQQTIYRRKCHIDPVLHSDPGSYWTSFISFADSANSTTVLFLQPGTGEDFQADVKDCDYLGVGHVHTSIAAENVALLHHN